MSENYCTTKGLGWAFLIVAFFIFGVPLLLVDNAKYCNQSILVPCYPWVEAEK
tara:strand:- start:157 stop:315 length:159 start_codon:yes stop_codon:yes gene_type:complete